MGKFYIKCGGGLCAYLILFLTTAPVCSLNDYYQYRTNLEDNNHKYHLNHLLGQEARHRVYRREAQTESNLNIKEDGPINTESVHHLDKTGADTKTATIKMGNHSYYNSTITRGSPETARFYWVDLNDSSRNITDALSHSHLRTRTIQLSFEFPFYGQLIKNVTITTSGFIFTGSFVHSWLAGTQYIAPLMANIATNKSAASYITYSDNGTAFTVEWNKMILQDQPDVGEFTFQTTLYKNGDIVFVYQNLPISIKSIPDHHHPVKVGLSDAYLIESTNYGVRRRTIYEYHRINFVEEDIRNSTVIYFTALPTCLQIKDCVSCLTNVLPSFQCYWCPKLKLCSNGTDRNRESWLNHCENVKVNNASVCSQISDSMIQSNSTVLDDQTEN